MGEQNTGKKLRWGLIGRGVILFLAMLAAAMVIWVPIVTKTVRILEIAGIGLFALLGVWTLIRNVIDHPRRGMGALAVLVLGVGAWMCFPSRPYNRESLRAQYLVRLKGFEGTRYVWGGERHNGIDCSGLARISLWEALIRRGVIERNPRLLGPIAWKFWWNDISANDMLKEKFGYTRTLGKTEKLAGYNCSNLKPGDLAVTEGGVHVLIYLGNHRWIEANPEDGKVTENKITADSKRSYFNLPVILLRWTFLDN